ncbi:MAG: hypothetical protein FWE25_09020 [Lachnospiraceae bacterium]|nr:hypothetical protein [Lachnospiraceae bacterium]
MNGLSCLAKGIAEIAAEMKPISSQVNSIYPGIKDLVSAISSAYTPVTLGATQETSKIISEISRLNLQLFAETIDDDSVELTTDLFGDICMTLGEVPDHTTSNETGKPKLTFDRAMAIFAILLALYGIIRTEMKDVATQQRLESTEESNLQFQEDTLNKLDHFMDTNENQLQEIIDLLTQQLHQSELDGCQCTPSNEVTHPSSVSQMHHSTK